MGTLFYFVAKDEASKMLKRIYQNHKPLISANSKLTEAKSTELANLVSKLHDLTESDCETDSYFALMELFAHARYTTTKLAAESNKNEGSTEPALDGVRIFVHDFYLFCKKFGLLDQQMEEVTAANPMNVFKYFYAKYMAVHFREQLGARLKLFSSDYFPQFRMEKELIFRDYINECLNEIGKLNAELDDYHETVKHKVLEFIHKAYPAVKKESKKSAVGGEITWVNFGIINSKVPTHIAPGDGFMKTCLVAAQIMIMHDLEPGVALRSAAKMVEDKISYEDLTKTNRSNYMIEL